MIRKFFSSPVVQIVSIVLAAVVLASYLGLTAFLSDSAQLSSSFRMETGKQLKIGIATNKFSEESVITPGEKIFFDPYIKNEGGYDSYIFLKVTLPDEAFHLEYINECWSLLSSTDNVYIYYYGSDNRLFRLPAMSTGTDIPVLTKPLCEQISLDTDTPLMDDTYTVNTIGYAIQSDGFEKASPEAVAETLGLNL